MRTLLLLAALSPALQFAQVRFEKGYIVDNDGVRKDVYIKNMDWVNNPWSILYKVEENGETLTAGLNELSQFGIGDNTNFVRTTVNIDRSSSDLNKLSTRREPSFAEETHFLKVLNDGKIKLYKYTDNGIIRYFYQAEGGSTQQLVYKAYQLETLKIGYNDDYRKQLNILLECNKISETDLYRVRYQDKDLQQLFTKYNRCDDPTFVEQKIASGTKNGGLRLAVRPRLVLSNAHDHDDFNYNRRDFGTSADLGAGLELEYVLPFNRNKWSFVFESTFRFYSAEKAFANKYVPGGSVYNTIKYNSIEFPLGARYSMFIGESSKIYINAQFSPEVLIGDNYIKSSLADGSVVTKGKLTPQANFVYGAGYKFKNRYGAEMRIQEPKIIGWTYSAMSLVLSYNIL